MSLKTKTFGSVAVLVVAVAAAFYFFDPTKGGRDKDFVMMSLVVTFTPSPRDEAVAIVVAANGNPEVHESGHESPWQESFSAPRGTIVTLTAAQKSGRGQLDCTINHPQRKVGPNQANLVPRPGTEGCLASVTA